MKPAWLWSLCVAVALLPGCATAKVNAGFPEVPLRKPLSGAIKVGVARVKDSRVDQIAGSVGDGLFQKLDLLVGPDLLGYVDRQVRNALANRGFEPVAALDPATTAIAQPYKVVVVTLQSATFGFPVIMWGAADSSVSIAVQVYAPPRNLIFSGSYSGAHGERPALVATGVIAGSILAVSADQAVAAAFADPKLEQALR
jgi:hypothetical protein